MKLARFAAVGAMTAAILGSIHLAMASPVPGPDVAPGANAAQGHAATPAGGGAADQSLRRLAARTGLMIGTAVDMDALAADATYRQKVAQEFNSVTAENVMKWQLVEPERGQLDWAAADELMRFAREHGQRVRGHTLVWHNQLPTWLTSGSFTPEELRDILRQHIIDEVTHFRGRIDEWDVVNEAFNEDGSLRDTIWLRNLGPGYIADAFRWAHRADPKARLVINDFNIEGINAKSDAVYELVKQLRRDGVPITGVGVQGHLGVQFGFSNTVTENLRRFQKLGLSTAVTEADVRMILPSDVVKLQAQARGYLTLLEACLLTEGCRSFTVWGFTDKYSWVPGFFTGQGAANILDENFQPKPAYEAIRADLLLAAGPGRRH